VFALKSEYKLHEGPVYGVAISENIAFTASADKTVKSIDLLTGIIQPFTVRSEVSPISLWAISPELLAIGYLNGELYLVNPHTRKILFEHSFTGEGVFSLYSFNDSELYIGLGSGRLAILDFVSLDWIYLEQISTDKIRAIVYDTNTHCCYIGAKDGQLIAFDVNAYCVNDRWHAHDGGVNSLCISSTNLLVAYIVSCSRDKTIKVWEMESLKPVQKITFHRQSVNQMAQQNAHSFVTASDDHRIAHWEYAE